MLVIFGLVVLLVAVIVGFTGVLNNAGAAHALTENFSVLGYHVTGSTGTLFLFGIMIGALAMLGMSVLLAGANRTARSGRDARRELQRSQRDAESVVNRDRDVERGRPVGSATGSTVDSELPTTWQSRMKGSFFGRPSYGDMLRSAPRAGDQSRADRRQQNARHRRGLGRGHEGSREVPRLLGRRMSRRSIPGFITGLVNRQVRS